MVTDAAHIAITFLFTPLFQQILSEYSAKCEVDLKKPVNDQITAIKNHCSEVLTGCRDIVFHICEIASRVNLTAQLYEQQAHLQSQTKQRQTFEEIQQW